MGNIIRLLPDSVANQIAAGEVIQNPASVVKELVENSIDAGASSINVLITDAGRTLIQVIDNGRGMSDVDVRLAFERHATSKILNAKDLFALRTMGFRGEALPSIASVAQVEVKTRMQEQELGTMLSIAASKILCQEPVSCSIGCNISVKNLFFNVPARRKFLKSNTTELANIITAIERIALVYPQISFSLKHNGANIFHFQPTAVQGQRICDIFGKRLFYELLPLKSDTSVCKICGFVGKPESARRKGLHQYFFVNKRFVRHPSFHKAVMIVFDRLIPTSTQVPYFIFFDVDPSTIDINIHPNKTEVKFENERAIWEILTATVRDAIGQINAFTAINFENQPQHDIPVYSSSRIEGIKSGSISNEYSSFDKKFATNYNPFDVSPIAHKQDTEFAQKRKSERFDENRIQELQEYEDFRELFKLSQKEETPLFQEIESVENSKSSNDSTLPERTPMHYQYKEQYIITEVKTGLMIIDQCRADVRIRYERILSELSTKRSIGSQRLLFPEIAQLSPAKATIINNIASELDMIGFNISSLGGNSFAINGVPSIVNATTDYAVLLENIADDAMELFTQTNARTRSMSNTDESYRQVKLVESEQVSTIFDQATKHTLALSIAKKTAITRGRVLDNTEMENLINDLFACSNANYTPDGKPIICVLPQDDIEKKLNSRTMNI